MMDFDIIVQSFFNVGNYSTGGHFYYFIYLLFSGLRVLLIIRSVRTSEPYSLAVYFVKVGI